MSKDPSSKAPSSKATKSIEPVALVRSPFRDKFGVPRQPGLYSAVGTVEMLPAYAKAEAFEGLEGFSHIWLVFDFSLCGDQWKHRVRPPRLGGNASLGVFASRSPFRPNNLGLSVVRLLDIDIANGRVVLRVAGLDLVDGTPVYDIKPYLPYADSIADALSGYAEAAPKPCLSVQFADPVEQLLDATCDSSTLRQLIEQVLALDPRPAYRRQQNSDRVYGMTLGDWNVRWRVVGDTALVLQLEAIR